MASPQLENGYTKIANEILEALMKISISAQESRVFWAIVRKTYGWKQTQDRITLSQFSKMTHMTKSNISRAIKKLVAKNMVIKSVTPEGLVYEIQKDYEKWGGYQIDNGLSGEIKQGYQER